MLAVGKLAAGNWKKTSIKIESTCSNLLLGLVQADYAKTVSLFDFREERIVMDLTKSIEMIERQIKAYLGNKSAVIGISGGIDSAVVSYLCRNAIGRDNVIGIMMPYDTQDIKDAEKICNEIGYDGTVYYKIDIKPIVDAFENEKHISIGIKAFEPVAANYRLTVGNIRARVRMTLLYAYAGAKNGLVVGTSNKTEIALGYFTKYGDGGCDIEPIGDLYKTEIFEVAKILGIPQSIIDKKPSAELWEGQTDEGEFEMTYSEIDEMLQQTMPIPLFIEKYGDKALKLIKRVTNTEHKRKMPPVFIAR
jgi:NAD+ synthase